MVASKRKRLVRGGGFAASRRAVRALLAAVLAAGFALPERAEALGREMVAPLALGIAYRLDRDLGEIDGAQRHLLIFRIAAALEDGELAPGAALSRQVLEWQLQLEALEPPPGQALPAWFGPVVPDPAGSLLLARDPTSEGGSWYGPRRWELAAAGTRLATGAGPPAWAAVQHPHLLAWARDHAAAIWARFLGLLAVNPDWLPLVAPAIAGWTALPLDAPLAQWQALEDAAAAELAALDRGAPDALAELIAAEAAALRSEDMLIEHRDQRPLHLAPYRLFRDGGTGDALDHGLISLARAIRGVARGRYAELVQVLLGLAEIALVSPAPPERLEAVLGALREIDPVVLELIEATDSRLLSVYQQVRKLLRDLAAGGGPAPAEGLRLLASLHAAHGADAADLEGYLSQPARTRIENDLLICFDASRERPPFPQEPITPVQFERCLGDFYDWALVNAASAELAGRSTGPFETDHLSRELELSPWQRINYWFGWLRTRLGTACAGGTEPLANPLEWALAARAFTRFARRWPAYFASRDRSEQLARLRAAGAEIVTRATLLRDCAADGSGPPLAYLMSAYELALEAVVAAIDAESARFRQTHLKGGADVNLAADAGQPTNYRPEDLLVTPCDGRPSCDMGDPLPPSRALLNLFPQPYLIADQIRLGSVSLCYTNVRWVERRAELPQVRNQAMARYFGRLSFELQGRYSGADDPIFNMRLTSQDEYEYLFAANSPEVLNDPCPRHLIGTQVRSELPDRPVSLVPRRLTFMTADRMHPAKVFQTHWAAGNEWRDRFVTGQGVEVLASTGAEPVVGAVDSRLSDLYRNWNRSVYEGLLDEPGDGSRDQVRMAMQRVDQTRRMVATFAKLLTPRRLVFDPATRAGVAGDHGLFDRNQVLKLRQQGVPVDQIAPLALSHFEDTRSLFARAPQPGESRSVADRIVLGTLTLLAELERRDR